jgi:hypothetical protein
VWLTIGNDLQVSEPPTRAQYNFAPAGFIANRSAYLGGGLNVGPVTGAGTGDVKMSGAMRMTASASKLIPGGSTYSIRKGDDSTDNWLITDTAGNGTLRGTLFVQAGINVGTATTAPSGEIYCSGPTVRVNVGGSGGRMHANRVSLAAVSTAYTAMASARGLCVLTCGTHTVTISVNRNAGTSNIDILGTAGVFVKGAPGATQIGLTMSSADLIATPGASFSVPVNLDTVMLSI